MREQDSWVGPREPQRTAHQRGYGARWQKARIAFLRRYPLCGDRPGGGKTLFSQCQERGIVTPATVVDHQRPHRGDSTLFWDTANNWAAMCASCHARKCKAGL
jgi:5-methylcytosine-specific restriction enzyme A